MKELLELFYTFFKIGAFTFGGGYAMLPIMEREVVTNHKWATDEEMLNYVAAAQCTPGVIAVNTATFIGYKRRGFFGALFATAGVVFPSLVLICVIAAFLSKLYTYETVAHVFKGISVAVGALILNTVVNMTKKNVKNVLGAVIMIAAILVTLFTPISPVFVVVISAIVGIIYGTRSGEGGGKDA